VGAALVEIFQLEREFVQRRRLFQRRSSKPIIALDGITFELDRGHCLALVGPNGAGKSTLLRILATLLTPSRGLARVGGYDVRRHPSKVRGLVGYAGNSDRSFFWPLTGNENLVFFGQLAGMTHSNAVAEAGRLLDQVGLTHAAGDRVSGYSAGMRQRLGLTRALIHRPQIIFLDEPTANLDAEYRDIAIGIINDFVADGGSVLVATHDPGLVSATATETLRLENGRMVDASRIDEIVRYRVQLSSSANDHGAPETLQVDDLGDGHVLVRALGQAVAVGRDVLSVEKITS
jgi:ABC-type multidrug transport system ATPase subunit